MCMKTSKGAQQDSFSCSEGGTSVSRREKRGLHQMFRYEWKGRDKPLAVICMWATVKHGGEDLKLWECKQSLQDLKVLQLA